MMSMNCRPPRAIATAKPAMLPAVKAGSETAELEQRLGDPVLDSHERNEQSDADDQQAENLWAGPAHRVVG